MSMQRVFCGLALLSIAVSATSAWANLVGGTYSTSATGATWPGSPAYKSLAVPNSGISGQAFPGAASGKKSLMSEIVTPSTSFALGSITIVAGGGRSTDNNLSIHLFPLSSSGGTNFFNTADAFYFVGSGTDLLGGGSGISFAFPGFTDANRFVTFAFNTVGNNDNPTLSANTSYAVEIWNESSDQNTNALIWYRASTADPGGQGFAKNDTSFSLSRNTLAANGLAGGAPRTFDVALTAVPEASAFVLGGAVCCVVGLGRFVRRNRAS